MEWLIFLLVLSICFKMFGVFAGSIVRGYQTSMSPEADEKRKRVPAFLRIADGDVLEIIEDDGVQILHQEHGSQLDQEAVGRCC